MRVAVVGCGYVGLTTAVGLARAGHDVLAVEIADARLNDLREGLLPFHEPTLGEPLLELVRTGRIRFTNDYQQVLPAELIFLCVETPSTPEGAIDLRPLRAAAREAAQALREGEHHQVVVVRSTVVPGTTENVLLPLLTEKTRGRSFPLGVVVNPEFLQEGQALTDFEHPGRIVIGSSDEASADLVARVYSSLPAPVIRTNLATAELIKYVSNALLATLISFSNQIALLCEALPDVDVEEVLQTVHRDRRWLPLGADQSAVPPILAYLKAGCGYGGSCLPKDVKALIAFAGQRGATVELLEAVDAVNARQPARLVDLAEKFAGNLANKSVLLLGVAFKAGTDDTRESPGLRIAEELLRRRARLFVSDPLVKPAQLSSLLRAGAQFVEDPKASFGQMDLCMITCLSPEFQFVADKLSAADGTGPIVVDGRRLLARQAALESDRYVGVGWDRKLPKGPGGLL